MPRQNPSSFAGLTSLDAFHCEPKRLASFAQWRQECPVSPIKLANDGFIFKGVGDEVSCTFCQLNTSASTIGTNIVREFHARHSPCCPIVKETDLFNIPIPTPDLTTVPLLPLRRTWNVPDTDENTDLDLLPLRFGPNFNVRLIPNNRQAAGTGHELYPKFKTTDSRRGLFRFYYNQHGYADYRIQEFVESGFFYIGVGDTMICFHCGLSLCGWLPGDNPSVAHARWNPFCDYIIRELGSAFIRGVQDELQIVGQAAPRIIGFQ